MYLILQACYMTNLFHVSLLAFLKPQSMLPRDKNVHRSSSRSFHLLIEFARCFGPFSALQLIGKPRYIVASLIDSVTVLYCGYEQSSRDCCYPRYTVRGIYFFRDRREATPIVHLARGLL